MGSNLYDSKCAELGLNDIRTLQYLDEETMRDEIGINSKIHRKMFVNKISKLTKDSHQFVRWLESIAMSEYEDILSGNGIVTFESLYYYVHDANDLLQIIGNENESDARLLWQSTPKMQRKTMR